MNKLVSLFFHVVVLLGLSAGIGVAYAYQDYDGCSGCHGDFNSGNYVSNKDGTAWGTDLMSGHLSFIPDGDCDICHQSGPKGTVSLHSSKNPLRPKSCVGCHGRDEDATGTGFAAQIGDGLRDHHLQAGVTTCEACHSADAVQVGEHVLPFNYDPDRGNVVGLTDACADGQFGPDGLDNDGDDLTDILDLDCQVASTPGDINGDGKADILWRNMASGLNWLYQMDGATNSASTPINTVSDQDWMIVGTGDANDDGKADILWRNAASGVNWLYLMDGSSVSSSLQINTVSDLNWEIVGNGDYNDDGKADILWRNKVTGENWIYLMDGATRLSATRINTVIDQNWKVQGSADYSGDGNDDILWRNMVSGENRAYVMNGAAIVESLKINTVSDLDWEIVGVGDANGDAKADILWRNAASGLIWLYLMDGATVSSSVQIGTVSDPNWEIVANGDYNGDTKADILWRNKVTGQNWMYLMDGATRLSSLGVNTVSDLNFMVVNIK